MSKINYTKVEEFLLSAQQKKQREQLLQEAHIAHMAQFSQGVAQEAERQADLARQQQEERDRALVTRLKVLQQRMRWFFKQDPQFYAHLGVSKETVVHYLDCQAETLSPEDWRTIEQLYNRCREKKPEIEEIGGLTTDEKWIKKARRKQKKKPFKFNQNERWLSA